MNLVICIQADGYEGEIVEMQISKIVTENKEASFKYKK